MFKRFFVLALAVSLMTTQTFAASHNGLKVAFDELAYSMEVEGAGLNLETKKAALAQFSQTLDQLQAEGLSSEELLSFAQSQIKDEALARDFAATFSLVNANKLSQIEVRDALNDLSDRMYAKGASWNGADPVYAWVGIAILVVIIMALQPEDPCADEAYARGNLEACRNSSYNGRYYDI